MRRPLKNLIASASSMLLWGAICTAQGLSEAEERLAAMLAEPRPIAALESPWIEDLTWMEVRDAIAAGTTTAIIPTGGIEQNGPYLATGKHNIILEGICPAIVQELGNALCAPIIGFVPEGDIDPPSGLMHFPGTISVRESTFVALVSDVAASLRQHGFTNIILLGDSGGNQNGLKIAADELNAKWAGTGSQVHFLASFYEPGWTDTEEFAADQLGVEEPMREGLHDDIYVTSMMMAADPVTVRYQQRLEADLASINGVDISDADEMGALGQELIKFRARHATEAIRSLVAEK